MKSLQLFLREFKRPKGDKSANWGSLKEGLWNVPKEQKDTFFKLVSIAAQAWNFQTCMGFVFRPPKTFNQQFNLDVDFKTKEEVTLDLETIALFTKLVAEKIKSEVPLSEVFFLIVQKETGYWDTFNKNDVFKSGFHLYFPRTRISLSTSRRLRTYCIEHVREFFGCINYTNLDSDCIDSRIPNRQNGLMMLGDFKPQNRHKCNPTGVKARNGGRYCVKSSGSLTKGGFHIDIIEKNHFLKNILSYFGTMYDFVFEGPDKGFGEQPKPKPKPKPKKEKKGEPSKAPPSKNFEEPAFCLKSFLEATIGWVPDEKTYVQICMFCANQKLDPSVCQTMCNEAWGYDSNETRNLIRTYNGQKVNRATIVYILSEHATKPWDERIIFPGPCYKFHNQARMFNEKRVWNIREVERFFTDVYSITWGGGDTEFIYKEKVYKMIGDEYYMCINTVMSGAIPFSGAKCDKKIMVTPPLLDLKTVLEKLASKKTPLIKQTDSVTMVSEKHTLREKIVAAKTLLKKLKIISDETEQYNIINTFLGDQYLPPPSEKSLSSIFIRCKQRAGSEFKEYHSAIVSPYLWEDRTPASIINIFPGFSMMRFAREGDIKKTRFYTWLWVCWANRDPYKLEWLLCYFAFKLQFPHRKVCKWIIAYANDTGVGKTSIRYFLELIFDKDKVLFCDKIEDLHKDENSEFLNKLFALTDDIEKADRRLSNSLKSVISSGTFKYKKLFTDRKTLPCYMDLIATSNSRNPTFVGNDDRRVELVVCNPEFKNNRKFWKGFYEEDCKSTKVAGIWFHYLAHKELTLDVTDRNCRFDLAALEANKARSMKLVHRFAMEWMQEPDCFENACPNPRFSYKWFGQLKFTIDDGMMTCFASKQRCYDHFQHWRKTTGQKLDAKLSTFIDDLFDIGIPKTRRSIDSVKLTGFLFRPNTVKKTIKRHYNLTGLALPWVWCSTEQEFREYQQREWRFRTNS